MFLFLETHFILFSPQFQLIVWQFPKLLTDFSSKHHIGVRHVLESKQLRWPYLLFFSLNFKRKVKLNKFWGESPSTLQFCPPLNSGIQLGQGLHCDFRGVGHHLGIHLWLSCVQDSLSCQDRSESLHRTGLVGKRMKGVRCRWTEWNRVQLWAAHESFHDPAHK